MRSAFRIMPSRMNAERPKPMRMALRSRKLSLSFTNLVIAKPSPHVYTKNRTAVSNDIRWKAAAKVYKFI